MIEIVESFPGNVVGILAKGEVTRKDYLQVLIPAIDKALKQNAKVRLYYELGSHFTGIDFGAKWEVLQTRNRASFTLGTGGRRNRRRLDKTCGGGFSLADAGRSPSLRYRPNVRSA